ncbi:MAG TPA: DNA-binding protein [bacterium]|nr:DNA-binding protein [bacterium]
MEKLLSVGEASDLLGLKKQTLYNLSSAGMVPKIKLNGRLLFSPSRLEKWIEQHAVEPVFEIVGR